MRNPNLIIALAVIAVCVVVAVVMWRSQKWQERREHNGWIRARLHAKYEATEATRDHTTVVAIQKVARYKGREERLGSPLVIDEVDLDDPEWSIKIETAFLDAQNKASVLNR